MRINLKEKLQPYTARTLKEKLNIYTTRPQDPTDTALGNNAELVPEYADWDESFLADMQIKEMAERWDR
jgi:hypothetical protein